jgi:hypothetical protein
MDSREKRGITVAVRADLTLLEIAQTANLGLEARITSLAKDHRPRYGAQREGGWQIQIEGKLGEHAFSKVSGEPWTGRDRIGGPDVGRDWQVRTTRHEEGCLIVHPADLSSERFVLLVGADGHYEIRGWVYGWEAKRPEYWHDPGSGRAAYWVPQAMLRPYVLEPAPTTP